MDWNDIIIANIEAIIIIKEKGYLKKAVAERAGFSEQAFSNMLNGRKIIKSQDIPQIANALGCTVVDIFKMPDKKGA